MQHHTFIVLLYIFNIFLALSAEYWIIGPEIKIVTIVHRPNLPPNITPRTTIIISNTILTIFTCQLFFSASEKVNASYDPRPNDTEAYKPVPTANITMPISIIIIFIHK